MEVSEKSASQAPKEPSAVQERLWWQRAYRDDKRVAQALSDGEEREEMHERSEAGLLDEFFAFLEEVAVMALVEGVQLPGVKPSPDPNDPVCAAVFAQRALWA